MATKCWPRIPTTGGPGGHGLQFNTFAGAASFWTVAPLINVVPTGSVANTTNTATVTGPTNGVEMGGTAGTPLEFITPPVDQDFTMSGVISANFWGSENNMSANAAINFQIEKVDRITGARTVVVKSARTAELATSAGVNAFTATPGAGISFNRGDRISMKVFADDSAAATMAAGFTWAFIYDANVGGVSGDSFITFNETFGFEPATYPVIIPTGTQLYLTNAAASGGINPGAGSEKEMWTSRGAASDDTITNTTTGPTAGVPLTLTAGGTAVEWYSRPLTAFTLAGAVGVRFWANISAIARFAQIRGELAITANDGTGATVVADQIQNASGLLTGAAFQHEFVLGVDDTAVSDGQRLRFRGLLDDSTGAMVSGATVTMSYDGPTVGAAGDSWIRLTQTVTEYTPGGDVFFGPERELVAVKRGSLW